ncbi:hypothetical protein ACKFKF_24610 [Phormidesmis sp. 146-12]
MSLFRQIATRVIQSGYLSSKTEQQLKRLASVYFDSDDIDTIILLQQALLSGKVQRIDD